MHAEDQYFFPLAERLLKPEDWAKIESELIHGNDPLFGGKVEEKFRKLCEQLNAWERESS